MAVLRWDTTLPDAVVNRVSRTLFSNAYSSLEAFQQGIVDDAGTMAYAVLAGYGPYFIEALTDDPAPGSWETWLWAEAVNIAHVNIGDNRSDESRKVADRARDAAVMTYNFDTADANTAGALTLLEIRKFVAVNLVRRGSFPPLRLVDYAAQWALNTIWNRKNWVFRRRPVTLTIATDSTVTVSGSIDLDSVNTRSFWYTDTNGEGLIIRAIGADAMAQQRATVTSTGRPEFFRAHQVDQAWVWEFSPAPDIEYTVRTEVLLPGPPVITVAASETPFAQLPTEFKTIVLDLTLARVLQRMGERDGRSMYEDAMSQVDDLGPRYEKIGKPTQGGGVRDIYQDRAFIANDREGWFD